MAFSGRVIAISGAGSGIGLGAAKYLALQGASISLADLNLPECTRNNVEDDNLWGNCTMTELDVRDSQAVNSWIKKTVEYFGRLDGAVNCAGILGLWGPVTEKSDEEWDRVLDINLGGTFRCLRAQLAWMNEGGSIVNLSSVSGMSGLPFNAPYCASKHAIIGLTKSTAKEVASKKIRVNCLAPGVVETPMLTTSAKKTAEQLEDEIAGHTPVNRMGTVEEVAKSIAFLLSSDSSYMTGSVLTVDGGMTA